jgi:phosphatidylserine decarboxylase
MTGNCHKDELFIALQRLIPQHLSSRLLGKIADSEITWLKRFLINQAVKTYRVDLSEIAVASIEDYPSFNAFFTRQLKAGARPIDKAKNAVVSPADGVISQLGDIDKGELFQAKGRFYSTRSLLACNEEQAAIFNQGSFATIYLSPRDYHRVHMPVAGKLVSTSYIPGQLFSVNGTTAENVEGLFARNERLVCQFETENGRLAVVLVGALFVAGIETVWQKEFVAGHMEQRTFNPPLELKKGEELGRFKFGSTVILVSEQKISWCSEFGPDQKCRMGVKTGQFSD